MRRLGWLAAVGAIIVLVLVSQVALQYAASRSTPTSTLAADAPSPTSPPGDPLPTGTATHVAQAVATSSPTGVVVSSTPQAVESPASSSTPIVFPTPVQPPSARLAQAVHLQEVGDTAQARREYAALILEGQDSRESVEARYRLAESYLNDRAYSEAVTAWRDYLLVAPEDDEERRRWATFMLGRAYEGAGASPQAIEAYETYLTYLSGEPPLVVEANERIAGIEMRRGNVEAAVERYVALLYIAPPSEIEWLRETLAQAYLALGDGLKAVAQYETLLEDAASGRQAQLHYLIAIALSGIGQDEQAYDHLYLAVEAEPSSPYAYYALLLLVQAEQEVDEYLRGLTDYYAAAYTPAVDAFRRYLADNPAAEKAGAANYFLGKSQYELGEFTAALAAFDLVTRIYPQSPYWDDAWFDMAATQARLGDVSAARDTYQTFARRYPQQARAAEALWEAAELLKLVDDMEGAAAGYLDLRRKFPESSLAARSLYWAGITLYRLGDYDAAAEAMRDLASDYAGSGFDSAALFWWGKSLVSLSDSDEAGEVWETLRKLEPDGWYMLRAEVLGALPEPTPSPPDDSQTITESWLRGWTLTNLSAEALRHLPPAIAEDEAFQRGREFLAVGLTRQGLAELEGVRDQWVDDPIAMYQLALVMRDLGAYRLSLLSAARLIALSPVKSIQEAPGFILHLAYPTYYSDVVEEEAARLNLDPWLFFSLIRQESLFDAAATSHADARGLTQVIPSTGDWVALQIGWSNFDANDLYRPYVSVKFGGYYLSRAIIGFDGDLLMALAGYNGGPGNAAAWRRRSGPDDDIFVATIGAFESRTYVRSVTAQNAIYRWLYGG